MLTMRPVGVSHPGIEVRVNSFSIPVIALLLPLAALAGPSHGDAPGGGRMLARLDLSSEQTQAFVPLLDEAAGLRLEGCEAVAELAPDVFVSWSALRDIVAVDGTPVPEVWRQAAALEREIKARREELSLGLVALEDEGMTILDEQQRALLEQRRAGRLGRALHDPTLSRQLYALAGQEPSPLWGRADQGCAAVEADREDMKALRAEVLSWNLLNGLHVSPEQAAALLDANDEAEAEAVLQSGQWEVLRGFTPCLIPSQDLSNPVRAGQAGAGGRYEKWLDRTRALDEGRQALAVDRLLSKEDKHLGPLPEGRADEVRAILAEASALDELAFALQEPDLLERLARSNEARQARVARFEAQRAAGGEGLVARFLLNDAFQDVLAQRYSEGE